MMSVCTASLNGNVGYTLEMVSQHHFEQHYNSCVGLPTPLI